MIPQKFQIFNPARKMMPDEILKSKLSKNNPELTCIPFHGTSSLR